MRYLEEFSDLEELSDVYIEDLPRIFRERYRFYRETVFEYFDFELEQVEQMRDFIRYSAFTGGLE